MSRLLRILTSVIVPVLIWWAGSVFCSVEASGQMDDSGVVCVDTLSPSCCDNDCYADWNVMEIASFDAQIFTGNARVDSVRVRLAGNGGGYHCMRSVYVRSGRLVASNDLIRVSVSAFLLPAGMSTYSHYFISLRKIRI